MKLSIYILCLIIPLFTFLMVIQTSKQINHESLNNIYPFQCSHSFGMRSRKLPKKSSEIYKPVIVQSFPSNETNIVRISNDTLKIFYLSSKGDIDKLMSMTSFNGGLTWGVPEKEFNLPGQAYHANQVIKDHSGKLQCIFTLFEKGEGGYRGRLYNLWYCHTDKDGEKWTVPQEIFHGYIGALQGFIQLKSGRLLATFAKAVPGRVKRPLVGKVDYGWNDIVSLYSDDEGKTWKPSDNSLKVISQPGKATRYGGIEPAIIELKDGRIWMLIRTNQGYLYESYSNNEGESWQNPRQTKFVSSNSPASLLRLADGRIVLFWCSDQWWSTPKSYADGGRQVLHAAISDDEGKTWSGFREVLTKIAGNLPHHGDFGTSYSSAVETEGGKIALVSGQGAGRAIVLFDPDWLEQTSSGDNFSDGLEQWTMFGGDCATQLVYLPHKKDEKALLIRKSANKKQLNTEAVWNFPMTHKGEIILKVRKNSKSQEINIALTDHFSPCNDTMANKHALFIFSVNGKEKVWEESDDNMTIKVRWSIKKKEAILYLNGHLVKEVSIRHQPNFGVNYLRIGIQGDQEDLAGFYIKSITSISK